MGSIAPMLALLLTALATLQLAPAAPTSGQLMHLLAERAELIVVAEPVLGQPRQISVTQVLRQPKQGVRVGTRLRVDAEVGPSPRLWMLRRAKAGRYAPLGSLKFIASAIRPKLAASDSGPWVHVSGWQEAGLRFPLTLPRTYAGLDGAPAQCVTPREGPRHLDTATVWFELRAFVAMTRTRHTHRDYGRFEPPRCD